MIDVEESDLQVSYHQKEFQFAGGHLESVEELSTFQEQPFATSYSGAILKIL